jgi:chromosome segregation protein
MYLSDIEIVGFKSFAQKTKLKFATGLSAVVGPNGCGKTNVVDAIRWVLGEKKASTLRSDVMENVIFNGTRDRKPLSLAEVSITFDNTKNILPSDYNEVVVTRRLFRNGDSEYLLNKTHCRLKDILDLFMDTGIGSDTYSVIELKMVDAILSGKVDDRRAMFEEAAGIKKYKARRKESLRKLESVKSDMERIQDILQEVRKNVNSLSRQAAKTKRYNQYLTELKSIEIEVFAREFNSFNLLKIELENKLKSLESKKISLEISLTQNEKDILINKEKLNSLDTSLNFEIEKEKSLISAISDTKKEIAVSTEKILSFDNSKARISNEIIENEKSLNSRNDNYKLILSELEATKSELSESSNNIKVLTEERNVVKNKVVDAERIVNSTNNEINSCKNKIDSLNNLINKSKEKRTNIERKIQQLYEDKFKFISQLDEITVDKKRNDLLSPELFNELKIAEETLNIAIEQKKSLESEIETIKLKINDKKNEKGGKKASLDFLNSLVDNGETAKFLSNTNNWKSQQDRILLGEVIGTDDDYRLAVLAALGESSHAFIADSYDSALQGINELKLSGKGKSGFICLDMIPEIPKPKDLPEMPGLIGWLSEIVRVDDNIRFLIRGLLGKTLLVEDEKTAKQILKDELADICVTKEGLLINKNGIVTGGSISQKEGLWVGKKEKIANLNKTIKILDNEIENLQNQLNELNSDLSKIEIIKFQQDIKKAEIEISENRKKSEQFELKIQSLKNNINFIEENSIRLENELNEIASDDSSSSEEINSLRNILVNLQNKIISERENLLDYQNQLATKQEILRKAELYAVEIESNFKSLENDKSRLISEINQLQNKLNSRTKELESFDSFKDELSDKIDLMTENLKISEESLVITKNNKDILISEKKNLSDTFEQISNENNIKRKDFDKLKESIHQHQIQETEVNSNILNILQRAAEQYETDISTIVLDENIEFDVSLSKKQIMELREKLSQLGNVNFMALEEYEIQNERLEFYEKQMTDLTESEKILRETIDEINSTAERNFRETFDKIQINFRSLFKKLFGNDGEADIQLESSDLLESDIIITAKPPNKRPHSIEMLSGGEKTLTAIALLFAIYLVKPSPFCILDEVDAPLDDANIDKFVGLIKEFSVETQFLIVTHNKKTMEAADTLYGVTMQEDGVSKVVAVKLSNDNA